jgi:nucleotide-binding universal stress UspA family protein
MRNLKTILFPYDGSEKCRQMAPIVRDWCEHYQSTVLAVNVLTLPVALFLDVPPLAWTEDIQKMCSESEQKMMEFLGTIFANVGVKYRSETGSPAECILSAAREDGVDLIAMPTHGYGPFRRLLLGSVTAKVLHDAKVPVLTSAHAESLHESFSCKSVVCATDLSGNSIPLLRDAGELARSWGARLTAVHAVPQAEYRPGIVVGEADFAHWLLEDSRRRLADLLKEADVEAQVCVHAGTIGNVVHEAATRHAADLVIAGRGHLTETLGRLRTHVHEIIRMSPSPVLTI